MTSSMAHTIGQILPQAITLLADSPSPRLDAEVLVMHVTGLTRAQLITQAGRALDPAQESQLTDLLARRARGEPVAYLTGQREFWSMSLSITPDVLIPRPETELLVEQALMRIPIEASFAIADLGTGSGAIALALAKERPHSRVIATDTSERALAVARANAARLGIANIEFRQGEWFAPITGHRFDLIVSNPPYIAEDDPHLAEGDVRFEPRTALVSGRNGLDDIRVLVDSAATHLKPGGWLLLEHGYSQGTTVRSLLQKHCFSNTSTLPDLAGQVRISLGCLNKYEKSTK